MISKNEFDNFFSNTKVLFETLSEDLFSELKSNEEVSLNLTAENQSYLRFNNSQLRQATQVTQFELDLQLQGYGKKVEMSMSLSGNLQDDKKLLYAMLLRGREELLTLPSDPFFVPMVNHGQSNVMYDGEILPCDDLIEILTTHTQETGFTGLYAGGPQIKANRNSMGQQHWFGSNSFFTDYSLFTGKNAVKGLYSNRYWQTENFLSSLQSAKIQLSLLNRPSLTIKPGRHCVFLAPAAAADLFQMLSWGALSFSAYKRGRCALSKVFDGEEFLSKKLFVKENFDLGLSPAFNSVGEVAPSQLTLIESGKIKNMLVNARTAKEYGVISNGSDHSSWSGEYLRSLDVQGGSLPLDQALQALGTGIYVGKLHYLNWSDIQNARITGMTRYACFWVENGEIVAPIDDLRFDESLYQALGDNLIDLTQEVTTFLDVDTYLRRALGGKRVPGLLIEDFKFTL